MKRTKLYVSTLLAIFLIAGLTHSSVAEVETIKVELFSFVTQDDARQIRRLLEPWAKPEDVKFYPAVDKKGRERYFTTVVEIIPRRDNKYRETHTFDIYNITRQLKDNRFRGSQAPSSSRVLKSEVTVSGELFAHMGWSRSYIRNVPFWRRWRGNTSAVNHAMVAGSWDQKIVFGDNDDFDRLRQEAGESGRGVRVTGKIAGFDGPYPVMSVNEYHLERIIEPEEKAETEEKKKQPSYDYLEKTPETKTDK